jgi:hypothetical protein
VGGTDRRACALAGCYAPELGEFAAQFLMCGPEGPFDSGGAEVMASRRFRLYAAREMCRPTTESAVGFDLDTVLVGAALERALPSPTGSGTPSAVSSPFGWLHG